MSSNRTQNLPISVAESTHKRALLIGASTIALALAAATSGAHAQSQPTNGFYVGGAAGANIEEDNHFNGGGANATDSYDPGFAGTLDLGYGLGNGIRLEFEPGYRNNPVDRINGRPAGSRTQMATMMGNAIYDFNQFQTPVIPLTPHIGAGIGYAHVWDRSGPQSGNSVSGGTDRFAYQIIGGLDYSLTPNQKIGVDYRYMVVHDVSFPVNNGLSTEAGDLDNHTFLATYRYEFNTPPAPPPAPMATPAAAAVTPPPPAPPPAARPYEVYFEFDRATLTPDARQVVQQAAQNALQGNATSIVATGHTDTVGTDSYNLVLSKHRASAVRAELIKDGVPGGEISTSGVGETDLAVQTGPNVNEPRNRRVEINVQAPGM
ncbi:MAG TPA: OmpA family protein [Stellaceae bacterium]|nr:OmpA family protein [Stellaceae bacterium]